MNENQYEYIIDAFTRKENNTDLEVNNLNVSCITSLNNKFELDSNGNLSVQSINVKNQNIPSEIVCNLIYPIGSIYMSVNGINPTTLFGGTWEQIKDKFLLSCGDNYKNEEIGGSSTVKLQNKNLPSRAMIRTTVENKAGCSCNSFINGWANICLNDATLPNSEAFSIMPPYLVVYIWKRIG